MSLQESFILRPAESRNVAIKAQEILQPITQSSITDKAITAVERILNTTEGSQAPSMKVILLIGLNGSGKGTFTNRFIKEHPEYVTVQTGEIPRAIAKDIKGKTFGTDRQSVFSQEYGPMLLEAGQIELMQQGELIEDSFMCQIVKNELEKLRARGVNRFIFDGFPRTEGQYNELERMLSQYAEQNITTQLVPVVLDLPPSKVMQRALARNEYNTQHGLPLRDDDQPEKVAARIRVFKAETAKMVQHLVYRPDSIVVNFADADQSVDKVYQDTLRVLNRDQRPIIRAALSIANTFRKITGSDVTDRKAAPAEERIPLQSSNKIIDLGRTVAQSARRISEHVTGAANFVKRIRGKQQNHNNTLFRDDGRNSDLPEYF